MTSRRGHGRGLPSRRQAPTVPCRASPDSGWSPATSGRSTPPGTTSGVRRPHDGCLGRKYARTPIVRHVSVTGRYSPDDPALAQYWTDRRRKRKPPQLAPAWERALRAQRGYCPLCRQPLLYVNHPPDSGTQWESWYRGIRTALAHQAITLTSSRRTIHRLIHADCATPPRRRHARTDQQMHDAGPPTRTA
jgi:hypothetical protein